MLGSKRDATTSVADPFIPVVRILRFNGIFELIDLESKPLMRGRNVPNTSVGHTCDDRSHTECFRRHRISECECSASTLDRRRRPGSASGPPVPVLQPVGPGPPPACSSSIPESSGKPHPRAAPRITPQSLGLECACFAAVSTELIRLAILACSDSTPVTFADTAGRLAAAAARSSAVIAMNNALGCRGRSGRCRGRGRAAFPNHKTATGSASQSMLRAESQDI
jgi:hypothetical protein